MIQNPYAVRTVLRSPELFFGRTQEQQDIFSRLAALQSVSVVGPRRIGKSSLLYHLTHPEVYRQYLPNADNYVVGYIDLQELAQLDVDDFFLTAVERLQTAVVEPQAEPLLDVDLDQAGTMRGFRRFLMNLRRTKLKLILCCDEFEMLSINENFDANFFTYLRGLCSSYDFALVTSSRAGLYELCHKGNVQTSQFWNIFVGRQLSYLAPPAVNHLIQKPFARAGFTVDEKEQAFVQSVAGAHPFFLQAVCYHLFAGKVAGHINFDQIEERFLHETKPQYAYAWRKLSAESQTYLHHLAYSKKQLSIPHATFQTLQQAAILVGTPAEPQLPRGWHHYIGHEINSSGIATETAKIEPKQVDLRRLRRTMIDYLSDGELRDVCFDAGVDFDRLSGDEKSGKIRELIVFMQKHNRLDELIELCADIYATVDWG